MFKVGDEVVCVDADTANLPQNHLGWLALYEEAAQLLTVNTVYTVRGFGKKSGILLTGLNTKLSELYGLGFSASRFRKVQRKNSRLSLEAFFTVPGGFEEPKRAPAKKKTNA